MSWAHPEGKNGTHRDYARRGSKKQPKGRVQRPRETPGERYERKLRELREAGAL